MLRVSSRCCATVSLSSCVDAWCDAVRDKSQACGMFSLETLSEMYAEQMEALETREFALRERLRRLRERAGRGGGKGG